MERGRRQAIAPVGFFMKPIKKLTDAGERNVRCAWAAALPYLFENCLYVAPLNLAHVASVPPLNKVLAKYPLSFLRPFVTALEMLLDEPLNAVLKSPPRAIRIHW
jgi:hypothetical protein